MKKITVLTLLLMLSGIFTARSQKTRIYPSLATEIIFSSAAIDNNGYDQGNVLRWSPVINVQNMWNFDFGNTFGLYTGWDVRNVGFIYKNPLESNVKYKYRTYNFGIPVGFKLGNLKKLFVFGGYEIEFPFNYKEKKFTDDNKDKFNVWFSKRVEPIQQSLMFGIQFPYGADLKLKYYLSNFHNRNFTEMVDGFEIKPYENLKSNLFYVSLSWFLFTNWKGHKDKADIYYKE